MKIIAVFSILIFTSFSFCYADNPEKVIEDFFSDYSKKNMDDSIANFFKKNKWMNRSKDEIDNLKLKLNSIVELIGLYHGHDFITQKRIGDRYILISYFVRHERQPLRFIFSFYKPNDTWVGFQFEFDMNYNEELKQASGLFNLPENR